MKLNVANIQHFSTGDGPGIRTTLFLKGCNLTCPWCHNPETVSPLPEELFYPESGKRIRYGREMTAEELLPELLEDRAFYEASGGGVTVSGGEPLLQSHALVPLAKSLFEAGISLIVDTAGCLPFAHFERLIPYTDVFFLDVKSGSPAVYRELVGGELATVYENLCRLLSSGVRVRVRIPLIPEVNTTPSATEDICRLLREAGVQKVDLLPFHRLGSGKYKALGREYAYRNTEPLSKQTVENIKAQYARYFAVTVEK